MNISIVIVLEMELSKEPGDQENREYFKRQKLPWLRSYLLERGIQISSDGKNKRKAEVVDLAVNAHEIKLAKFCDGESEDMNNFDCGTVDNRRGSFAQSSFGAKLE